MNNAGLRRGLENLRTPLSIAKSDHVGGLRIIRSYDNSVVCSRHYEMRERIRIAAQNVGERKLCHSKIAQSFHEQESKEDLFATS